MAMIDKLPIYYKRSKVTKDFYDALEQLFFDTDGDLQTKINNLFVATTDEYDDHEADVGITEFTPRFAETRRAQVITRLRGFKLLTVEELKRFVKLFDKTGCEVLEDFPNYKVTIDFAYRKGYPYNYDQLRAALEEIKPAHLVFDYIRHKNTWQECHDKIWTWGYGGRTWDGAAYFDGRRWLKIDRDGNIYECNEEDANAFIVWLENKPYAYRVD